MAESIYCTTNVRLMEERMDNSKCLPEWLITPNTLCTTQKCDFSPENKQKPLTELMIVEIT
jgi:hypothetical protein